MKKYVTHTLRSWRKVIDKALMPLCLTALLLALSSCQAKVPQDALPSDLAPAIFPDYSGVTVPVNIAPLNFKILTPADAYITHVHPRGKQGFVAKGPLVDIDVDAWHCMLQDAQGDSIYIDVYVRQQGQWLALQPFAVAVAGPIDPYISYRLIEPSYVTFERMNISQRCLENWEESPIFNNSAYTDEEKGQCLNCHSYQDYNRQGNMQMHLRMNHGGTLVIRNGHEAELVNLKTPQTIGPGVYPSWHPTLPLIAYSVNKTDQIFHSHHRNKVEVQDAASDLILYDVETNQVQIISNDSTQLECFPYWNHDGTALYYVSAQLPDTINSKNIAAYKRDHYRSFHYDIYKLPFDTLTRTFGAVDTVFQASRLGKSAVHPRESRDGRYLMFTLSDYGVFPIWHHDADLYLLDLETGNNRRLDEANSDDTESYHSFSSSGEWFIFSSRRDDGNYTRLYISRLNPDGTATKPFLLPQRTPDHNTWRYKSYNVPEFMASPVQISRSEILDAIACPAKPANTK